MCDGKSIYFSDSLLQEMKIMRQNYVRDFDSKKPTLHIHLLFESAEFILGMVPVKYEKQVDSRIVGDFDLVINNEKDLFSYKGKSILLDERVGKFIIVEKFDRGELVSLVLVE